MWRKSTFLGTRRKRQALFFVTAAGLLASVPYLAGVGTAGERTAGILLNFATAWISYLCFDKIFQNQGTGIVCSALYTLSAFHTYKLIVAGALGESAAYAFLPLVLYGGYRIFTEEPEDEKYRTAWVPAMLGVTGVMWSHAVTGMITALALFLFCLFQIRKVFRRNTLWELAKAAASSFLLSLWPLYRFARELQERYSDYGAAVSVQSRGLQPAQQLFYFWTIGTEQPAADGSMQYAAPVGIGLLLAMGLAVFLILWFSGAFPAEKEKGAAFAKRAAVVGMLFVYMSMKIFPWDRIQFRNPLFSALVSSLQFPNRFLSWATVCLVLVFGVCLSYFGRHDRRWLWGMAAAAFLGIVTSDLYLLDYTVGRQDNFVLYEERNLTYGNPSEEL